MTFRPCQFVSPMGRFRCHGEAGSCVSSTSAVDLKTLPRSGRPRKLTEEDRDQLYDVISTEPCVKYQDLMDEVDNTVKKESIRRLVNEMALRKWRQLSQPALSRRCSGLEMFITVRMFACGYPSLYPLVDLPWRRSTPCRQIAGARAFERPTW